MNSQDNMMPSNAAANDQRPTLLKVLCILTFIAAGLTILGSLLSVIGMGSIMSAFGGSSDFTTGKALMLAIPTLIFAAGKVYGAWQMWQLKKIGFFIYTASAIAVLVISPIVMSLIMGIGFQFNYIGFGLTAVFVGLYYTNVKVMK